jgi:hypothetical protein
MTKDGHIMMQLLQSPDHTWEHTNKGCGGFIGVKDNNFTLLLVIYPIGDWIKNYGT